MTLKQTLNAPISGYWDGGTKSVFEWTIDGQPQTDSKGQFVRVGSFAANNWFMVALGKTDKMTLGNARRRLSRSAKNAGMPCKFEYIP